MTRHRSDERHNAWQMPQSPFSLPGVRLEDMRLQFRDRDFQNRSYQLLAASSLRPPRSAVSDAYDPDFYGVRDYLSPTVGEGHWDLYEIDPHLYLTVTDAKYHQPFDVVVKDKGMLKFRVLLRGELLDRATRRSILRGPSASLSMIGTDFDENYLMGSDERVELVILHFFPSALTTGLRLEENQLPQVLRSMMSSDGRGAFRSRIELSADIASAAADIVTIRSNLSKPLRQGFLRAKSYEILCLLLQSLLDSENSPEFAVSLSRSHVRRITEAREYLKKSYAQPPAIPALARMVGVNRTKMKSGFKELFGCTIYEYVLKCRMERARELLLKGDRQIAWIAEEVGYAYPANFTHAFKKYFGYLPKNIRP